MDLAPVLRRLEHWLADTYCHRDDQSRIVDLAGMRPATISFTAKATLTWHNILKESIRQEKLVGVVQAALDDYPANRELRACLKVILQAATPGFDDYSSYDVAEFPDDTSAIIHDALRTASDVRLPGSMDLIRNCRMRHGTESSVTDVALSGAVASELGEAERRLLQLGAHDRLGQLKHLIDELDLSAMGRCAKLFASWLPKADTLLPQHLAVECYVVLAEAALIEAKLNADCVTDANVEAAKGFLRKARALRGQLDDDSRLEASEAYLLSFEEGSDVALGRLSAKRDHESFRVQLSVLVDAARFPDAATLVRAKEPNERWCVKAVCALARVGDFARAREFTVWAESLADLTVSGRCRIVFAESAIAYAFRERREGQRIIPGTLTKEEQSILSLVLDELEPLVMLCTANRRVNTGLDAIGLELFIRTRIFIGNLQDWHKLSTLLETRTPVSLVLAELAVARLFPASDNLPARLRTEHPESLNAKIWAALIEGDIFDHPETALTSLTKLDSVVEAQNEDTALDFCKAAFQLAQRVGESALSEVSDIVMRLIGSEHVLTKQIGICLLFEKGEFTKAGQSLEEIRDETDPHWLQMYARYLREDNKRAEAAEYLLKAAELLPHPALLESAAVLCFEEDQLHDAAQALERRLLLMPEDIDGHKLATSIYTRTSDYEKAAEHFSTLAELEPSEHVHSVNEAISWTLAGHHDRALAIYEKLCAVDSPTLEAVIGRAQLLKSRNRSSDALGSLVPFRELFWEQPAFVATYMDIAYAAGEDPEGERGLQQMIVLQHEGRLPEHALETKTLDDLSTHARQFAERRKTASELIVSGRAPWLMADRMLGRVAYHAWALRTRRLDWLEDVPEYRAEHTVYSTNGFSVVEDAGTAGRLEALVHPAGSQPVMADLSSLITLHRLDLLDATADYFGRILVPSEYFAHAVHESNQLVTFQRSQHVVAERVKKAIDAGRVSVCDDQDVASLSTMVHVNEYDASETSELHYCGLRALAMALHAAGKIGRRKYADLVRVSRKEVEGDGVSVLRPSSKIVIELYTLRTISHHNILNAVTNYFQVFTTASSHHRILLDLSSFEDRERLATWHTGLWDLLNRDDRFEKISRLRTLPPEDEWKDNLESAVLALDLAEAKQLPLLVDDRMCQALFLNSHRDVKGLACGSDRVIVGLHERGAISAKHAAESMLQLMRWRYRFVVAPPLLLRELLNDYIENPPGDDLRFVAEYVQDCMQDPGLFSGPEECDNAVSMAFRLFQEWVLVAMELVAGIWQESILSDEAAVNITHWVCHELLPTNPKSMGIAGTRLTSHLPESALTFLLAALLELDDPARANACLCSVAQALGLSHDQYTRIAMSIIHGFRAHGT
ncbi:MAG: hypothetical protein GY854_31475 [Deltaproteobacteria bacterium]|nr:hypothetical protein [Deltaproteobacteria bacterium]